MDTAQFEADVALRFSILSNNSRFDWDQQLRYAREQKLYPPDIMERYIKALTILRQLLGDSFLRQMRYTHPLASMILDAGPWQVQLLCDYAALLRYLRDNDPGHSHLQQKLLSPEKAKDEAMHFLHIGHLLRSAGLDVRFPAEIDDQKNPDITITDPTTGQVVSGEVSRVDKSQDNQDSEHNYYQLRRVLAKYLTNPLYSALQVQAMPADYLANLGPLLTALQQHVAATNEPQEYTDNYFTITLFPLSQQDELYAWMDAVNRRKDLNGPPQSFDETRRISSNKIVQKAKQILSDNPGILFIPVSPLHFWQQRVTETTAIFQRRMQNLPQILGVYLHAESLHIGAEGFRFNTDDGFDRTAIAGALARYSLFVPNPAFNRPVNPDTHAKLLSVLSPQSPFSEKFQNCKH